MSDDIAEGVAVLREIETRWIADALAEAISSLAYPVGMGIAPNPEHLARAAGKMFDRYAKMIEMAATKGPWFAEREAIKNVVEAAQVWHDATEALYAAALRFDDAGVADDLDSKITDAEEQLAEALSALRQSSVEAG